MGTEFETGPLLGEHGVELRVDIGAGDGGGEALVAVLDGVEGIAEALRNGCPVKRVCRLVRPPVKRLGRDWKRSKWGGVKHQGKRFAKTRGL